MTTEDRTDAATIENLLREERLFPPPPEFMGNALLNDPEIYERTASEEGFRAFWTEEGNRLDWMEPWSGANGQACRGRRLCIGRNLPRAANDRHAWRFCLAGIA